MDENYDVETYRDYLIKNGLDPAVAAQVAQKTKGADSAKKALGPKTNCGSLSLEKPLLADESFLQPVELSEITEEKKTSRLSQEINLSRVIRLPQQQTGTSMDPRSHRNSSGH